MNVIDLDARRKGRELLKLMRDMNARLREMAPDPEDLGWLPVRWTDDGRPYRWLQPRYHAYVGYVPGTPELVYLDYAHRCTAYDCSIEELVVGLETGLLPDPVADVRTPED